MSHYITRRILWRPLLLAVVALMALLPIHQAAAATAGCRSDPVVVLSDGTTLDLSAGVSAPVLDVVSVSYTLHIPAGVQALLSIHTAGLLGPAESFAVYSDNVPGHYSTTTLVTTRNPGVAIHANTLLLLSGMLLLANGSASGYDDQALVVAFAR